MNEKESIECIKAQPEHKYPQWILSSSNELDSEWIIDMHVLLMIIHSGELPSAIYPIYYVPRDTAHASFYSSYVRL